MDQATHLNLDYVLILYWYFFFFKFTCELAKLSFCLSFFSWGTWGCLSVFQFCPCSPFSYNTVSLSGPVSAPFFLFIIPLLLLHASLAQLFLPLSSHQLSSLLFLLLIFIFPSHPSICSCYSCLSPLFSNCPSSSHFFYTPPHLSLHHTLSGISLWRWIWSQCVSTATSACRTTWNGGWQSANVTRKRRRRNYWYPCVFDPPFLLFPHFCCSLFGQFPSSLFSVSIS